MRKWIANIILGIGVAAALVAVGFWVHFIWSFEWGRFGSRSWGIWFFFVLLPGMALVGGAVIFVFVMISALFDRD
jgi:hypothetical protein